MASQRNQGYVKDKQPAKKGPPVGRDATSGRFTSGRTQKKDSATKRPAPTQAEVIE